MSGFPIFVGCHQLPRVLIILRRVGQNVSGWQAFHFQVNSFTRRRSRGWIDDRIVVMRVVVIVQKCRTTGIRTSRQARRLEFLEELRIVHSLFGQRGQGARVYERCVRCAFVQMDGFHASVVVASEHVDAGRLQMPMPKPYLLKESPPIVSLRTVKRYF